jgi:hypothetical protein
MEKLEKPRFCRKKTPLHDKVGVFESTGVGLFIMDSRYFILLTDTPLFNLFKYIESNKEIH